jgi:hypothetical protein
MSNTYRSSRSFERHQKHASYKLYKEMLDVAKSNGFGSISHAISVASQSRKQSISIYELDNNNEPADFVCRFNSLYELSQWEKIETENLMLDIVAMTLNEVIYGNNIPIYKLVFES